MNRRDFLKTVPLFSFTGLAALNYPNLLLMPDGSILISIYRGEISSFEIPDVISMKRHIDIEYFSECGKQAFIPSYLREYALEDNIKNIYLIVDKIIGQEKISINII